MKALIQALLVSGLVLSSAPLFASPAAAVPTKVAVAGKNEGQKTPNKRIHKGVRRTTVKNVSLNSK
jgi:hypothetical protein